MFAYIEVKTIQSASGDLRAAIDARHVVTDELPPPPDKAAIKPAANLKDPDKIATSIEERYQRALDDHREAVKKLEDKRAAAAAAEQEWRDPRKSADTARIQLGKLWLQRPMLPMREIAARLGRTMTAIQSAAHRFSLPGRETLTLEELASVRRTGRFRGCMTCDKQFFSTGPENRLCSRHRHSSPDEDPRLQRLCTRA